MQFSHLSFLLWPQRDSLTLEHLPTQCNITTLWARTGQPLSFYSVKVIAIMIHKHCLFPSMKCHSDLSYFLHLEYHHLNPSLFHFIPYIFKSLLTTISLSSSMPTPIFLPIILLCWVIYFLKTLNNHVFSTPLSSLLYETVKVIYNLEVSNFISHSYHKMFRKV